MAGPAGLLIGAIVGGVTVFKMFNKELDDGKTGLEDYVEGIDLSTGKTEDLVKVTQGLTETQRDQFKTLQNIKNQAHMRYKSFLSQNYDIGVLGNCYEKIS